MSERRCPSCGALVAIDAEWCGQCYATLREPAAAPSPGADRPGARTAGLERSDKGDGPPSAWRCPVCDAENGLEANTCRACGTPFSRLFEDAPPPSAVSPGAAAAWSLLLPGLGHWFAGRRADAIARFVLTAWVGGMLVVLLSSGDTGGLGVAAGLDGLFAIAALALWAEAAIDARRAAAGLAPVVSSRMMLWACVALVGVSMLLATILALPGVRSAGTGPVR
jgi:ribosomal protein L40E